METFEDIRRFYMNSPVSYLMLNLLTVYPGTKLYKKAETQNRLLNLPSAYLNGIVPTMKYKNMNTGEMLEQYIKVQQDIYSYESVLKKANLIFSEGIPLKKRYGLSWRDLLSGIFYILKTFVFTRDKNARLLFQELHKLARKRGVASSFIMEYLFFMQAGKIYFQRLSRQKEELLKQLDYYSSI
ncbi:MAG TPA: hypothetical protein DC049_08665 [Spirochaetia bacterium]|nr:hypothetical protein [Spirochaetia bacterium]